MTKTEQWKQSDYYTRPMNMGGKIVEQKISKTLVSSYRYRPSTLATIARFIIEMGERPTSTSDIIKIALESFEDMILAKDSKYKVSSETESIQFLQSLGIIRNPSKTNQKRIYQNLSLESFRATSGESNLIDREVLRGALEHLKKLEAPPVQGKGPGKDGEYSNSEMKRILQQMRENNQQVEPAERKG